MCEGLCVHEYAVERSLLREGYGFDVLRCGRRKINPSPDKYEFELIVG
jgi:hypothetical protein